MKKIVNVILLLLLMSLCNTILVYGEPAIIGTRNGSDGAGGTWDGVYEKEADGDSLKLCYSGDAFGYVFADVPAGVYKIAHYMTLDSMDYGKRIRISPRVSHGNSQVRCWVDWYTADVIAKLSDLTDADHGKIILVSVIQVPKDGMYIDIGFWQDTGAYVGALDKVVLATEDYDFQEEEYVLIGEKSYDADHVFNEDPEQLLLAGEGTWTPSTMIEKEPAPTIGTEEKPSETPKESETEEETAPAPAMVDYIQLGLLIAIIVTVVVGVVGVIFLVKKKEKK